MYHRHFDEVRDVMDKRGFEVRKILLKGLVIS